MSLARSKKNHVGLNLNGTHQLLVYADDVNPLWDNIDTIKKNTETLIGASKEVGLEVKAHVMWCWIFMVTFRNVLVENVADLFVRA
jgi:hypothetical protein